MDNESETDLAQLQWKRLSFEKLNRPTLRNSHCSAVDKHTGKIYVFGGRSKGGSNNNLYVLDLSSIESTTTITTTATTSNRGWVLLDCKGEVPQARKSAGMAFHKGTLYLFGGTYKNGSSSNDFYAYSIKNNTWREVYTKADKRPTIRDRHTLTCIGDSLFLFGGHSESEDFMNNLWEFHITKKEWINVNDNFKSNPIARYEHCAVALESRNLLVILGGKSRAGGLSDAITFDVTQRKWKKPHIKSIRREPCWGQSAVVFNKKILIFGGWNGRSCFNDLLVLATDLAPWEWMQVKIKGERPSIRTFHTASVVSKYMAIVAGRNMAKRLNDTFILDLTELRLEHITRRKSLIILQKDLNNITFEEEEEEEPLTTTRTTRTEETLLKKRSQLHLDMQYKASGEHFAMKMLRKTRVVEMKQENHIKWEKKILSSIRHPFIVNMEASFQNPIYLFLVLELINGGEFFTLLRKLGTLRMSHAVFYATQIVLVFQFLHKNNIIYRDLKPENLLIADDGYLRLTDFGFAKKLEKPYRTWTLCGTPEYIAPEILLNRGHSFSVDWWALGILIFEMSVGNPPFVDDNPMKIYQKILSGRIQFPVNMHARAKDFISKLLTKNLSQRLGNRENNAHDVMKHPFFEGVDWKRILEKQVKAPYIPQLKSIDDTSLFDDYDEDTDTEDAPLNDDPFEKDF